MLSEKAKRNLQRIGWAYVAYHILIAVVLVASSFQGLNPDYWRRPDFHIELLFVIFVCPALIPGLVVCGGLRDHCTTLVGSTIQFMAFLAAVAWYLTGFWVIASLVVRRFRN